MNARPEADQLNLFKAGPALAGLKYQADLLSRDEEARLLKSVEEVPFKAFEFHGYLGKRRTVSFGWHYNFSKQNLREAQDIPAFLLPIRDRAAHFADVDPSDLQHVLITEYSPGAGIGWHKDKLVFGEVIGLSLLSPCIFRLRRKAGASWERTSFVADPRSAYLLKGPARTDWEHSIPPLDSLRYSITFRKLRSS